MGKTSNTLVIIALVAVVAYFVYTKGLSLANLQFIPRGITIAGNGFQVVLGVQNTSNTTLQYNSFAGSLIVNGSAVGNVSDFTAQPIAANAETDLTINISANVLGIASQIMQQLQSGGTGIQSASLSGTANISGVQYPVNVQLA